MITANPTGIADRVVRRAQRQGYVVAREVREELTLAGASDDLWKDVLALARQSLTLRRGRYYYSAPVSAACARNSLSSWESAAPSISS